MLRTLVLAALIAAPLPVLAQDANTLDLVATILGGVSDGAHVALGPTGDTTVSNTGPGAFELSAAEGDPATLTVTEFGPCVFDIAVTLGGAPVGQIRFDSTKVVEVTYTEDGASEGLNDYRIELKGEPGVMSNIMPDGTVSETTNSSQFRSSVTLDELNAAVAAFHEACPAMAS